MRWAARIGAALAVMALGAVVVVMVVSSPAPERAAPAPTMGLGQNHMLISVHQRRAATFQLAWNAPAGATGYTVYIARKCPSAPATPVDAGDAAAPIVSDAGCINAPITNTQIVTTGCGTPGFCCVNYPGAPAPAGQHDGIVVGPCYHNNPDGSVTLTSTYIENAYYFDVEKR